MKIAEIYLNQTNKRIDKPYDYAVPEQMEDKLCPGMRVLVTFGKGQRYLDGFVVHIKHTTDFPEKIKPIEALIDQEPVLNAVQIMLCTYLKQAYCSLFYEALHLFDNPVKLTRSKGTAALPPYIDMPYYTVYNASEKAYRLKGEIQLKGKVQKKIQALLKERDFTRRELIDRLGDIGHSLRTMEKKGIIEAYEWDFEEKEEPVMASPLLNPQEEFIYQALQQTLSKRVYINCSDFETKIAVYLKKTETILKSGQSVLFLCPEIHLTTKVIERFYRHFGQLAAVHHGQLSQKERNQIYKQVKAGNIRVLIGSRAALFMPMQKLGLIILEDEYDPSYRAVSMPRYDSLDVAFQLSRLTGAQLIVSDELPSIRMMYAIENGDYAAIPDADFQLRMNCQIVDMQEEMKMGNFSFMSHSLTRAINHAMEEKKKIVLLHNRQGYASYVFCRSCGYVEKCPTCGVSLKYYMENERMKCPYCGYTRVKPSTCPQCGGHKIREMGFGIDQVEMQLKKFYPDKQILKVTGDLIENEKTRKALETQIIQGDYDILLGTRILLRDFTFENVGLAGALLIDSDFNHGDYMDAENAWLLYGRFFNQMPESTLKMIQTYESDHPVVELLEFGDIAFFYRQELQYRNVMGYPPEKEMMIVSLFHEKNTQVSTESAELYQTMKKIAEKENKKNPLRIFEPFFSGYIKKSGQIRYRIIVRADKLSVFCKLIKEVIETGGIERCQSKVAIDINPSVTL